MSSGETVVPASYGQRRLWFFDRLQPGSPIYNCQIVLTPAGPPDVSAAQRALDELVRRHEILRTTYAEVDGAPVQRIHPPAPVLLAQLDFGDQTEEARGREIRKRIEENRDRAFDIERGPVMRAVLIRPDARRIVISVCVHHIAFDDWSADVFGREFTALYEDFRAGRPASLAPPALQYAAYSAAQRARYDAGSMDPQLDYWRDRLRDLPATTEMPTDRPRPPAQTFVGETRGFSLKPATAAALREMTRAADATLFMSLFAAYAALLYRHTGQADLVVGTPVADRNRPELSGLIGFFVSTLVLRVDLSDDPGFAELLARVRATALGALANQDVPFERLVEELRPERDPSRQPLFQTMFVFQYGQPDAAESTEIEPTGAKFDITLTVTDAAPAIRIAFDYNVDLFARDTVALLAERYDALIAAAMAEPDRPVSQLAIMTPAERERVVSGWNRTDAPLPARPLVHEIVAEVAAARPEAPALRFSGESVSYGDLVDRARALAGRLRARGVGPEVRVGLCLRRSPDWIVAMLAVLEAGGALVPLDPALPADRLAFMAGDAALALVLADAEGEAKLAGIAAPVLRVPVAAGGEAAAGPRAEPSTLAYVIYTSGSTGRPKGVLAEHAGLANLALAQGRDWRVGPGSRVLQFAAPGFDAALSEVFSTLCLGGCLHLAHPDELMPGPPLLATLREGRITHITLPPSVLAAMAPDGLPDLALVVSAGEACDPGLAARWAQGRRLVNAYGPTEVTVCATMGDHGPAGFPVGRPIANMRVYALDRHGEPVPPGVVGEIHVGGVGVARGYLDRPELTAERFVPDRVSGRPGRLYRTGDLGRFDAAGALHHLGRTDRQLKVRGYRIEPGEVESVLRRHPGVADAAVTGLGTGAEARLIAYLIPEGTPPLVVELRAFVAGLLPDYMAPAAYVTVESWPKTPNGKLDHAALPRPEALARSSAAAYAAPEGEAERRAAAIWRDCLNVAAVGLDDNFFDLGGHSMLLLKVHGRLRDEMKSRLTLVDLFRYPTVRLLAAALKAEAAGREGGQTEALGRADQRAAQQNAARLRRRRIPGDRNG